MTVLEAFVKIVSRSSSCETIVTKRTCMYPVLVRLIGPIIVSQDDFGGAYKYSQQVTVSLLATMNSWFLYHKYILMSRKINKSQILRDFKKISFLIAVIANMTISVQLLKHYYNS